MEERKAKLITTKGGSGSSTFRATLPAKWIRVMGLNEETRNLILKFDGKKILIENDKEENRVTGEEYMERYNYNPDKIEFEGNIYTESDLVAMDRKDYEEVMEYGKVIED